MAVQTPWGLTRVGSLGEMFELEAQGHFSEWRLPRHPIMAPPGEGRALEQAGASGSGPQSSMLESAICGPDQGP